MTTYQRLGDYIREVNVRNRELRVTNLLGLSMSKQFRPSTSNIVGVDLTKYKVVDRNVFAFDPMSVIRVHKVPIAINDTNDPIIVSPAYYTFEVIDSFQLLPQYLMMWFQRTEFDRYADFKSDAAVRGGYDWDELCNTPIYIPSITRQREIVSEYETLTNRIRLNNQMIQNLEATAQTLYRKTFVDNIDKENLPEGWRMGMLGEVCETQYGYTETATTDNVGPKFLRITDIVNNSIIWKSVPYCHISDNDFVKYKLELGDIVVSRTGANIGWAKQIKGQIPNAVFASFLIRLKVKEAHLKWLIGYLVESSDFKEFVAANQQGSAQPQANANILVKYPLLIPNKESLCEYNEQMLSINRHICVIEQENELLTELQSLLLAKMGQ